MPFSREIAAWAPERVRRPGPRRRAARPRRRGRRQLPLRQQGRRRRRAARSRGRARRTSWSRASPLDGGPQVWSSTYVRTCLAAGDVEGAAEALGRPFTVPRRGASRATGAAASSATRRPTSRPSAVAAPADGVYAGWLTRLDTGERFPPPISVGTNPTFAGERDRRVEAYVLDRTTSSSTASRWRWRSWRGCAAWSASTGVDAAALATDGRRRTPGPRAAGVTSMTRAPQATIRATERVARRPRAAVVRRRSSRPPYAGGSRRAPPGARRSASALRRGRGWSGWPSAGGAARRRWASPWGETVLRRAGRGSGRCRTLYGAAVVGWAARRTLRSLGPAVPAGLAGAAAAAALHHLPLHQHRGVAGRLHPRRRGACGRRCCSSPCIGVGVPAGAAARGDGGVRRRPDRRAGRRGVRRTPVEAAAAELADHRGDARAALRRGRASSAATWCWCC